MNFFRRRKSILEGIHNVTIVKIGEKQHNNGKLYFIITVKREVDGATREFWIDENSYLIEKIIDILFKGDEREEFNPKEFIGVGMMINVKKSEANYFNITDIYPVDEYNEDDKDEDDEDNIYEENNLEDELFKEEINYVQEDDEDDDLDLDFDDIFDEDNLANQNLRSGRRR